MKKRLFFIVILFFYTLHAQKSLGGFDKITAEQIALKQVPFEKDADAVILSEVGYINITGGNYRKC